MQGGRGAKWGTWSTTPGGRFSLGRLRDGSGYCIGAVVATRMGLTDEGEGTSEKRSKGKGRGTLAGNGMRDVWVLGEAFFRGVGAVFDVSLCLVAILYAVTMAKQSN